MKRFLKSYLVFTSLIYRIMMFIIVPIVIIGAAFLIGILILAMGDEPEEASCIIVLIFMPMVEIISDNWIFGGIQSKSTGKLDYLKTSGEGINVLRSALVIDLIRKFFFTVGITGITYCMLRIYKDYNSPVLAVLNPEDLICIHEEGFIVAFGYSNTDFIAFMEFIFGIDWGILLCAVLISYFFSVVGTVLVRFGELFWINWMIAYLMGPIAVCIWGLGLPHEVIFIIPFVILDAAVSIMAVRIAIRKVEKSYYDK